MKTIFTIITLSFYINSNAQSFYGMRENLTTQNLEIFKTDTTFSNIEIVKTYTFNNIIGAGYTEVTPFDSDFEFCNNKVYGVYWNSKIFSIDTTTNLFTTHVTFNDTIKGLELKTIKSINNKLYGVSTYSNSKANNGLILFEYNPLNNAFRTIVRRSPSLITVTGYTNTYVSTNKVTLLNSNGKFYFNVDEGYQSSSSSFYHENHLYECDTITKSMYSVISYFSLFMQSPFDITNKNNKIYGTAQNRGLGNSTLFEYNQQTLNYSPLAILSPTSNAPDLSGFMSNCLIYNNNAYALAAGGTYNKGVILKTDLIGNPYTSPLVFNLPNNGFISNQTSFILPVTNATFYGTLGGGGNFSKGVVFKYNTSSNSYTKVYNVPSNTRLYPKLLYTGVVSTSTNIKEQQNQLSLTISPNPANNYLNITISNTTNTKHTLCVTDVLGKTLIQQTFEVTQQNIDVSHLSAGVYYISITNENNQQIVQKIIKE